MKIKLTLIAHTAVSISLLSLGTVCVRAQAPAATAATPAARTDIPLYFQPASPASAGNIYLVTVDGGCTGAGGVGEAVFYLWLNTVFIPSELAAPGVQRAWSLRTALPLIKSVREAGPRGAYLTIYEIQTDNIDAALAARSDRIAEARKNAPNPALQCMKESQVTAYKATTDVKTKANTPAAPYGSKATPAVAEPPPVPGTRRFLLAVETNLKDKSQAKVFDTWFNDVNTPDVLTSPGNRGVVRLERVTKAAPGRG